MARLIAIEGVDGSGKQTQAELLCKNLRKKGKNVHKIHFPNYESVSSALVKMYLNGDFSGDAEEITPYIASTFYAADRYASYITEWKKYYEEENSIILADRYTTANMIHQAAKLDSEAEKETFLDWLCDFEYNLYKIPKPDMVIFLKMPLSKVREVLESRNNKIDGGSKKDIHEKDFAFMEKSFYNAMYVAKKYGFFVVDCEKGDKSGIKTIGEVEKEVLDLVEFYAI